MDTVKFCEMLYEMGACTEAMQWAEGKSWEEVYNTCHRGDWLMWLFEKTNPEEEYSRLKYLTNGHIANTVRHLVDDKRITDVADAAIAYGNGEIERSEMLDMWNIAFSLSATYTQEASHASMVSATVSASRGVARVNAKLNAINAAIESANPIVPSQGGEVASTAAWAAWWGAVNLDSISFDITADAVRVENRQATANIVRKMIQITMFNI